MTKSKAKPKTKITSRASKSATKSKFSPKVKPTVKRKGASFAASHIIEEKIRSLGDWRGETLAELRRAIHQACPDIVEECKWVKASNPWGVPVWSHAGIICTGETYKEVVKLTFVKGASLDDPHGLFNSSLEGNTRRAIDIREGDALDAEAFKALIQTAVKENLRSSAPKIKAKPSKMQKNEQGVVLLSGGNPQIAKAYGDAPVQAYIAAMPGWKGDVGRRLDAIIERTVPHVYKAVKWNTPFYGIEGQGWFLGFHCFAKYVKVSFFRGTSLRPIPPGESKQKEVRYLDIYEDEKFDEAQFADWVKQASKLPGEKM
ncbi:MAG TPA: DUF1801 domain-containing protein [Gemmatales bacterium]|nr:DUF1801 domain-containing protein [Gemmatales bacterium]